MEKSWLMTQEWCDLLFLHWPVQPAWIKKRVPEELELDLFDGVAWIGVVPFKARGTRLRFTPPIPGVRNYLELNVRTYVKFRGKPGVFFFSLDADSPLAVTVASFGNFLPYRHARMDMKRQGRKRVFKSRCTEPGSFPETLWLKYDAAANVIERTSLETWLTERYCLWTKPKKRLYRIDIEHTPWRLRNVKGEIYSNSMAAFLPVDLHLKKPLAHFGGSKKVRFYPPVLEKI